MNRWNQSNTASAPVTIVGQSIVILHKILKEEDQFKAMRKSNMHGGQANLDPIIAIDFSYVTSIQEDYKNGGTVIIDKKTAVIVKERLSEVLEAWIEIQDRIHQSM